MLTDEELEADDELVKKITRYIAEVRRLRGELEHINNQGAACLVLAKAERFQEVKVHEGNWSPLYQAVLNLRRDRDRLKAADERQEAIANNVP